MALVGQAGNADGGQFAPDPGHAVLVPDALHLAGLQVLDRGHRPGCHGRRQGRGEDEARGKAADEVADGG